MKTLLLITALLSFVFAFGQKETHTLEGRITLSKNKGTVYLFLVDSAQFKIPFSGIDTLIFPVNYDKTKIDFKFENLPEGTYGLRAYQDSNGNGKIDQGLFRPREPWALSWKEDMKIPPRFEDISFDLKYDLRVNLILGN